MFGSAIAGAYLIMIFAGNPIENSGAPPTVITIPMTDMAQCEVAEAAYLSAQKEIDRAVSKVSEIWPDTVRTEAAARITSSHCMNTGY